MEVKHTHPVALVALAACTHTDLSRFLLVLSLPRCNRINEPITGYRSSHGFKGIKAIILPPIARRGVHLCACRRGPLHAWSGTTRKSGAADVTQRLPLSTMEASGPINLLSRCPVKQENKEEGGGQMSHSEAGFRAAGPAHSDLSFTASGYLSRFFFFFLPAAISFSISGFSHKAVNPRGSANMFAAKQKNTKVEELSFIFLSRFISLGAVRFNATQPWILSYEATTIKDVSIGCLISHCPTCSDL